MRPMNRNAYWAGLWALFCLPIGGLCVAEMVSEPVQEGQCVKFANARFTILSPTCVRMEYSTNGTFTDLKSVVVLNRDWAACPYSLQKDAGLLKIKTERLEIAYRADNKNFNPGNLAITWVDKSKHTWKPQDLDNENLGGTYRSLDRVGGSNMPAIPKGLLSRNGWTLLDDSSSPLIDPKTDWLSSRPQKHMPDWYFFLYGNDFKYFFREYVKLAGKIPMLPKYALGNWYSRWVRYKDWEEEALVDKYRSLDIPLDVLVIDMGWHQRGPWEGYDWNTTNFPDPNGFLKRIKAKHVRVTLNQHQNTPLPTTDSHYKDVINRLGITGKRANEPFLFNLAVKDEARAYLELIHHPIEKQGVDFWWIDASFAAFAGLGGDMWVARVIYDGTHSDSDRRSLVFSRYGGLGQHRYPIGFSGDTHSEWGVLKLEVSSTAQAGNVLFPYWSHDIGGFMGGKINTELYVRWTQFGCLSPIMRCHSEGGIREPWNYGTAAEDICRNFIKLRYRLIPYLYTYTRQVHDTGAPLVSPLYINYPDDENAYHFDQEYLLGDNMLVCPVTQPGTNGVALKEVYLPKGSWLDWWERRVYEGPLTFSTNVPLDRCPIFVRGGGIIPLGPAMDYVDQKPCDPLEVRIFPSSDGEFTLYEDDGESMGYLRGESQTTTMLLKHSNGEDEFRAVPVKGSYKGALLKRNYQLVFDGRVSPVEVRLDGKALQQAKESEGLFPSWSFDNNRGETIIRIKDVEAEKGFTLKLIGPNH